MSASLNRETKKCTSLSLIQKKKSFLGKNRHSLHTLHGMEDQKSYHFAQEKSKRERKEKSRREEAG